MIRAIIFDCFGVLTTDAWLPFKSQHFGNDAEAFEIASDLNRQSDAGFMSHQTFIDAIGKMTQMTGTEVNDIISKHVPNHQLFDYLKELKMDYKIGLLSNASGDWLKELFKPEELELFDAVALSYETHFTKPMAEAYQTIADRLGMPLSDCVFIDDQERFVTGARDIGMSGIWYKDNEQCRADLTQLLADTKA